MAVRAGGIGAGGNIEGSALGDNSQVANISIGEQHFHQAPVTAEVVWPVEVGPVPALASAFQPRSMLRERIDKAHKGSGTVVLTHVLSGGGGVGKTQLAAAYATDALAQNTDVVVWAAATEAQQVITQYAQAAARIGLPGVDGREPEADARALLEWLAITSRRWLVVLDDITDPTALSQWWPASRTGTGWVLATTRLNDARMTGGGRARINIDVYTPDEAHGYLHARLTGEGMTHLLDDHTSALAEALGHLPLALSHAAAYMINEELTCTAYLNLITNQTTRLQHVLPETADAEGYGRQITATLLLSLSAVQASDTTGLAIPALSLTALLDPAGHPHSLWTTPPLLTYLTSHYTPATDPTAPTSPAAAEQAHTALRLLHRYALLTCDTQTEPRAIRLHALTARAVRENIPDPELSSLTAVAADALLHIWPDPDQPYTDLTAVLRANTDALAEHSRNLLWHPHAHPVLHRAGNSLLHAGLAASATAYWQHAATNSERLLGEDHPDTLTARNNLAASYGQAGRIDEAIGLLERVVVDHERVLGEDQPDTLTSRGNLAASYRQAGRIDEAIGLLKRVIAECERVLGEDHPHTLTARGHLAVSYRQAGRIDEAIGLLKRVIADDERVLGADHPDTLTSRGHLAVFYRQAGRIDEAVGLLERVVADQERVLGADHPHALTARNNLAVFYRQAGRIDEAVGLLERVVADHERLLGHQHPDTAAVRTLLVTWQQGAR
ncbi:tetratricopeptide repeat protein [Streptomyces canus]|uniref:tetratricopeptide repeat protein n=1 Tax=Streptomyces canus TaxID=58343 RepID=UPI002E2DA285|nr:tetratricopeptide repeat protein [Streptomyces canus]